MTFLFIIYYICVIKIITKKKIKKMKSKFTAEISYHFSSEFVSSYIVLTLLIDGIKICSYKSGYDEMEDIFLNRINSEVLKDSEGQVNTMNFIN